MMEETPDTGLLDSLKQAGWDVEPGCFGCNGNPKKISDEFRIGLGNTVCRQWRVTRADRPGFAVILSGSSSNDLSVEISAKPNGVGFKLGRSYFYSRTRLRLDTDTAETFIALVRSSYEDVWLAEMRETLTRVDAYLAGL